MGPADTPHYPSNRPLLCGLLLPVAWTLRRPLLAIAALLLRAVVALIMPALLVLGAAKAWQLALAGAEKRRAPIYPGDSESLSTPAAELIPKAGALPADGI